jgi:radical SAM protein with 4Fe4S-binding SPASM domain
MNEHRSLLEKRSLPEKRVHHVKDDIHLLVNPYWGGKFVTDHTGSRVIELMSREGDEETLIDLISQELNINPYETAARYIDFIGQLERRRMLGWAAEDTRPLPRPNLGFLEITRKCSTRCRLCYVNSGEEKPDTLSKDEILAVVDQMGGMGVNFVALSGGDPLAREDFLEILEYIAVAKALTAGLSTSLLTLSDDAAKRMKELGVLVQVSLDGSTPEVNDWNRGQGSFEKTMGGVELLNRHEIPFRFAYVINKHNLEDIESMVELGLKLGAKEIAFGKVKIAGRARDQEATACPTTEDIASAYHTLYRKAIDTRETGLKISCKHNQALLAGLDNRVGCLPCGAGRTFLQVSYNGDIIPCSLLTGEEKFVLGNVRKDKLKDIWETSPTYDFFRNTTVDEIEVCRNCPAKYLCGGGCRGDAYLNNGDLLGPCSDCKDLIFYYDKILDRGCKEKNVIAF